MIKKFLIFLFFAFIFGKLSAVTILDSPPTDTPTPEQTEPSDLTKNNASTVFAQGWVAPSTPGSGNPFRFTLNSIIQNDIFGFQGFSLLDIYVKRDLDDYSVRAEGMLRLRKNFSSSDTTANLVELRLAKVSYLESWIQVGLGRMDLSNILSPTEFFGFYPTMGIRRLDGISAILPIRLAFGGEDIKGITTPPTSLSVYYFPSLFSGNYVSLNGQQAYLLGQARLRMTTNDIQTTFRLNLGGCSTDYFTYSSVSGNTAFSFCVDSQIAKQFTFYGEYGIQNLALINGTGALALGGKVEKIGTWGPFSFDSIDFETQIPIGQDLNNAFTGGNTFFPQFALLPQIAWYGSAKVRLKSFFIQGTFSNSMGDYTFERLSSWPTALKPVNIPLPVPFGPGNEVEGVRVPLINNSYSTVAFLINAGVDF